jgi:hypothetical protein
MLNSILHACIVCLVKKTELSLLFTQNLKLEGEDCDWEHLLSNSVTDSTEEEEE